MEQTNKLINEKSPYLLQHSHNPVYWYPWCDEAFKKAKAEDKPIFLSIGYSTCHWCHVMAHESFEDNYVADLMNKTFICIKVDKEERPDIDSIYMNICQAITGQGGWPLTIIMTPEQKPFYAGTYLPKTSKYNMLGLTELINAVGLEWKTNQNALIQSGNDITNLLYNQAENNPKQTSPTKEMLYSAKDLLFNNYDETYGGFGSAPKFPTPHNLMFLLRFSHAEHDKRALEIVEKTLEQMYKGGIYDHIGFGFCRYSTDRKWLAPHFEKMLYDNALLIMAYLEAYQITQKPLYCKVAENTLTYISRELTSDEGGFYCAQDADSEGIEGKYYLLTPEEIIQLLGEQDGNYFNQYFDITKKGNFEGKSIPNLIENQEFDKMDTNIEQMINKVYEYRLKRTALHKDDKILTSWNALMIVAFAKAYQILGDIKYLHAAQKATIFIEQKLTAKDGRLFVRYRDGDANGTGNIDDYAFYIWALLELYQATFEADYLEKALQYCNTMIEHFYDKENGGFYLYADDAEQLIHRPKEIYDGAIPSGNSVATYVLLKLSELTGNQEITDILQQQLEFIAGNTKDYPAGYSFSMIAALMALYPSKELICVLKEQVNTETVRKAIMKNYNPNLTTIIKTDENDDKLQKVCKFTVDYHTKNESNTYYLCENRTCAAPIHDLDMLQSMLNK